MIHTLSRALLAAVACACLTSAGAGAWSAADGPRSDRYREGQRALSEERWSDAHEAFAALAAAGGSEADAALYWQAWSESKLGRRADALGTLRELLAEFPESEWIDDARVLEADLGGRRGYARLGDSEDEELKLYALDALMQVEPERAEPILERFLAGDHSLRLKERALFVLAQSDTPRARRMLVELVRSGSPPELRLRAIEQLGIAGGAEDLRTLAEIWQDATPAVKAKVIEAWMMADDEESVAEVARREVDRTLRRKAIEMLGVMDAIDVLRELYAGETDPELRIRILEAYGIAGDVDALAEAARAETDPRIRAKAIEGLGITGEEDAARELRTLFESERDPGLRGKIAEALMIHGDAETLVALFRQESDREMKRVLLQQISLLDDDAVESLVGEILEDRP